MFLIALTQRGAVRWAGMSLAVGQGEGWGWYEIGLWPRSGLATF